MKSQSLTRRSFLEKSVMGTAAGFTLGAGSSTRGVSNEPTIVPVKLAPGEKLRVGIIGCGNRSRAHISAINHYEGMEVAALCDILPEMMEEKKKLVQGGNPRLYTDYEEMVRQEDLHAVAIATPNTVHQGPAVGALEAGKHVLCEKPLTLDVSGAKAIIETADRNRKVLQVGTQSRHSPAYARLAQLIREGLVGRPLYAWIHSFRADWRKLDPDPEVDARINWRMKREEGGDVTYEMGIHTIDLFNWFLDSEPVEITCMGGVHNEKLEKRDSWDHTALAVRYANGALVTYGANLYSCGSPGPDILFGDVATLQVGGRRTNKIVLQTRTYWRPYGMKEDSRAQTQEITLPSGPIDASTLQFGYFLEAVQGRKPPFPSGRDHLPAVLICKGAAMSAEQRRHIKSSEVV